MSEDVSTSAPLSPLLYSPTRLRRGCPSTKEAVGRGGAVASESRRLPLRPLAPSVSSQAEEGPSLGSFDSLFSLPGAIEDGFWTARGRGGRRRGGWRT